MNDDWLRPAGILSLGITLIGGSALALGLLALQLYGRATIAELDRPTYRPRMTRAELIAKMQGRIDLCRRLAASTLDQRTAVTLRLMADEGERDLAQLKAEQNIIPQTPQE